MFKKTSKKRITIDLTESNYNSLAAFSDLFHESNNNILNHLVYSFLNLAPEVKHTLASACYQARVEEEGKISSLDDYESDFASKRIESYNNLINFFTDGTDYILPTNTPMKKIEYGNGYIIIPDSWIVIEPHPAMACQHVGIITVRNRVLYNAPFIVVFSQTPINHLSDTEIEQIYIRCEMQYPEFKKLRAMQVTPVFDKEHNMLNGELWAQAPILGLLPLPRYGYDTSFPYGAMAVEPSALFPPPNIV